MQRYISFSVIYILKLIYKKNVSFPDVDVAKPDEKSVMTYVAQFLKAYPEAGEDPAVG